MLAVVVAVSVGTHHLAPPDMHGIDPGVVCLAVVAGGLALLGGAGPPPLAARLRQPGDWRPLRRANVGPRPVQARAGPRYLQLQMLRR